MSDKKKPSNKHISEEDRALLEGISKKFYPIFRHAGFDDQTAETMVLNVATKFLRNRHKIQKSEDAYLNRIANNEIKDQIRGKGTKRESLSDNFSEPSDIENNVKPTYQSGESNLILQDILNTLTVRQQEIFRLLIDGYNQREISKILKITTASVSYHIRRLRHNAAIMFGFKSVKSKVDSPDESVNTLHRKKSEKPHDKSEQ